MTKTNVMSTLRTKELDWLLAGVSFVAKQNTKEVEGLEKWEMVNAMLEVIKEKDFVAGHEKAVEMNQRYFKVEVPTADVIKYNEMNK